MKNKKEIKWDNGFTLRWSKKIRAINRLGGKCIECGNDNIFSLDFHHPNDDKESSFSLLKNEKWSVLEKEINKCVILCANCHSEKHYACGRSTLLKKEVLDLLEKEIGCSLCGYHGKNLSSLTFHHNANEDKKMNLSDAFSRKYSCSLQDIVDEIKKCSIICLNCHRNIHVNKDRFKELSSLIYYKVNNVKERKVTDEDVVRKMKEEGKTIKDISIELDRSPSTIYYIFHRV